MISKSLIKLVRSLELKKGRRREGLFVAEGPKVVGDLIRHGWKPWRLVATKEWREANPSWNAEEADAEELRRLSFLQHPQYVVGIFPVPDIAREVDATIPTQELCLALDGVQDPGNVGTILRIADWFGIHHIYCSADTADIFNPKVVQATMGSIARVRVDYVDLDDFLGRMPVGTPVYGTLLDGEDIYGKCLSDKGVIVMGNEGNGISAAIRRRITQRLLVPRYGSSLDGAESLNVAIATAVVCSEFKRQSQGR